MPPHAGTVLALDAKAHAPLKPYLAALYASCITDDNATVTFLLLLSHKKLLAWWKERIAEVVDGSRRIWILVSRGGARALAALEREAARLGRHLLLLHLEADSPAKAVCKKLIYTQMGRVPRYGLSPSGELRDGAFLYKHL